MFSVNQARNWRLVGSPPLSIRNRLGAPRRATIQANSQITSALGNAVSIKSAMHYQVNWPPPKTLGDTQKPPLGDV